jgi:SCP-2 sterol transfer family
MLPPPAASKVYELTEDGRDLARAIVPLAAWGVRILAANRRKRTEAFRPAWGLLFLSETFDASSARDVHDVYEFHIDDSVISVIVDDGEMQVIEGQSGRPVDVEIHVDATTFIDVGVGRLRGRDAIRQRKLRLVGSEAALRRYSSIIRPLARPRPGGSRLDRHGGSIE